ncbi:MAG: hypothetical protein ACREEP_10400, partial [Dongiaceae bacterium]
HRVERVYEAFLQSDRTAMSIYSSCIVIDSNGADVRTVPILAGSESAEALIAEGSFVYGCSHAWHRAVFEKFGPLPIGVGQEDEVIPFRSLLLGTIARIEEPLVRYRLHESNLSLDYRKVADNEVELQELYSIQFANRLDNLRCYLKDLEKCRGDLPESSRERMRRMLLKHIKHGELEMAFRRGNLGEKLNVILKGGAQGVGSEDLLKWLFRIILPGAYLRYSYYKYRKRLVTR